MVEIIRGLFITITLLFLFVLILRKTQDKKLNWAIFYSLLYTSISLVIVNNVCVHYEYWGFTDTNSINIPFDIAFICIVLWGVIPVFFLEKKYFLICLLFIFWSDFVLMPQLEIYGLVTLSDNWLIGEFLLISLVFIPAFIWAYCSYHNKLTGLRAVFQIIVMTGFFVVGLPYVLHIYGLIETLNYSISIIKFQVLFIISFPALVAVLDLVTKGKGTPFPYDPTKKLVRTGVYAYCRNPIQWSFTLLFIPLSIYHSSWYLLIGSFVSIAYAVGVSDFQEYPDMELRFGEKWKVYTSTTPKWYFQWKTIHIPKGTIYFDFDCGICSDISQWFIKQNAPNLVVINASEYKGEKLQQVTYVDVDGNSSQAIASALEHINLAYASLGWFLRLPIISFIVQAIVDATDFENNQR